MLNRTTWPAGAYFAHGFSTDSNGSHIEGAKVRAQPPHAQPGRPMPTLCRKTTRRWPIVWIACSVAAGYKLATLASIVNLIPQKRDAASSYACGVFRLQPPQGLEPWTPALRKPFRHFPPSSSIVLRWFYTIHFSLRRFRWRLRISTHVRPFGYKLATRPAASRGHPPGRGRLLEL